jgi:hypothetical protein
MRQACGMPLRSSLTRNSGLPPGTNATGVSSEERLECAHRLARVPRSRLWVVRMKSPGRDAWRGAVLLLPLLLPTQESAVSSLLLRLDHDCAAGRDPKVADRGALHGAEAGRGVHGGSHPHRDARHCHPHGLAVVRDHK